MTPAEVLTDPYRELNQMIFAAALGARAKEVERASSQANVTAEGLIARIAVGKYVRG